MAKTATLNLRVDPYIKDQAEKILDEIGMPISTAIDVYLKRIISDRGIPFSLNLPEAPASVDVEQMTAEELESKMRKAVESADSGKLIEASKARKKFFEDL